MPESVKEIIHVMYRDATVTNTITREYDIEYALWKSRKEQKTITAMRQKNRKKFESLGLVTSGDGLHIHHIDGNPYNNKRSNLEVVDPCQHNKKHGRRCVKTKPTKRIKDL